MIRINQLKLPVLYEIEDVVKKAAKILKINENDILEFQIVKESLDARKKPNLSYNISANFSINNEDAVLKRYKGHDVSKIEVKEYNFKSTGNKKLSYRPIIIGAGPAGLFCGYYLAKAGYKPIILERGEEVRKRVLDVENFFENGVLHPDSNVQFGEGGAGTFSDGKLNTMIKDKHGHNAEVLKTFVKMGANSEILYKNKPHIGTDVLIEIVENIRNAIISYGGEVLFHTKVTELLIEPVTNEKDIISSKTAEKGSDSINNKYIKKITGVRLQNGEILKSETVILAIGHSARDTFSMLLEKEVPMKPKPFAVGLRVEHLQSMINHSQLAITDLKKLGLKAADYKLTAKITSERDMYSERGIYSERSLYSERGIYSFCMCPGGYVVNASSEPGHLAINGMSYSKRDGKNANSAIVITVFPEDFPDHSILGGISFQRELEKNAYNACNGKIPYQRYEDFKQNRPTVKPGNISPCTKGDYGWTNLRTILPESLNLDIIKGMEEFARKIQGFADNDTLLSGVETRTSSPVRIIRNEAFQSDIFGLYPCGEGAGYAGGITSAAVDGLKIAEAIASLYASF